MNIQMQHQEGVAVCSARVDAAPVARVGPPLRCACLMCSGDVSGGPRDVIAQGGVRLSARATRLHGAMPLRDFRSILTSQGRICGNNRPVRAGMRTGHLPVELAPDVPACPFGAFFVLAA